MLVLGLETSCDETAAAVVEALPTAGSPALRVMSEVVYSQVDLHARYGGVVPELASRAHVVQVIPVVRAALDKAGVALADLGGIAVTNRPGLVGALLVGVQTAKAMAWASSIPLVGVHHLVGHLSAILLEDNPPPFPHLALIVSGGHTCLVKVDGPGQVRQLGATRDDAAGEAFDKGAKLLGLGYPGGAVIDRLAATGNPLAVPLPRAMAGRDSGLDFSFSGLKTALLHHVREYGVPDGQQLADLCASYQAAIVEVLTRKTRWAARYFALEHVQICGGVAANRSLRTALAAAGADDGFTLYAAPPARCTDNAAMIAAAGAFMLLGGDHADFELAAHAMSPLPMQETQR